MTACPDSPPPRGMIMITVITKGGCWEQGRRLVCLALVKCLDRNGRALERDSPEVVLDVCARACVSRIVEKARR